MLDIVVENERINEQVTRTTKTFGGFLIINFACSVETNAYAGMHWKTKRYTPREIENLNMYSTTGEQAYNQTHAENPRAQCR
jgi:hypothetical protein